MSRAELHDAMADADAAERRRRRASRQARHVERVVREDAAHRAESLSRCPITLGEAHAFVTARHHAADVGALFAIAAVQHDAIVGVVGTRNACSMLYGAARRRVAC